MIASEPVLSFGILFLLIAVGVVVYLLYRYEEEGYRDEEVATGTGAMVAARGSTAAMAMVATAAAATEAALAVEGAAKAEMSAAEGVAEASSAIAVPLRRPTTTATACRADGCDKPVVVGGGLYPRKGRCLPKSGGVFFGAAAVDARATKEERGLW